MVVVALRVGVRGGGWSGGRGRASHRGNTGAGAVEPASEGEMLDSPGEMTFGR